jgi:hypothetical protein
MAVRIRPDYGRIIISPPLKAVSRKLLADSFLAHCLQLKAYSFYLTPFTPATYDISHP